MKRSARRCQRPILDRDKSDRRRRQQRVDWQNFDAQSLRAKPHDGGGNETKPTSRFATDDRMIAPPAQRQMSKRAGSSIVEVKGSHAIYVSQPKAVAALIEEAAKSIGTKITGN
jgi:hypothetical protein